jgi:hypothetical protein
MKFLAFSQTNLGSSLALPANGLGGSRTTSSLVAYFAKQNTKFGGGGKNWNSDFRQKMFKLRSKNTANFNFL